MAADPPERSLRALEDERAWRPRAATVGGVAQAGGSGCSDSCLHPYTHIDLFTHLRISVYVYAYLSIHIYISIYIHIYVYIYLLMYVYIHIFIYISIYIIHKDLYTYIYTCVPTCSSMVLPGGQGGAADPQERAQGGAADPLAATQCRPGPYSGSDGTRGKRRKQSRAASPETLIIFGGVLPAQVESGSELVKACSVPKSLRRLRTRPWGS